jgi:hypothetical protein
MASLYDIDTVAIRQQQVILTSVDDWILWLKIRMLTAKKLGIKDYVDPEKDRSDLLKVVHTPPPACTQYKTGATSLADLDAGQASNYRQCVHQPSKPKIDPLT